MFREVWWFPNCSTFILMNYSMSANDWNTLPPVRNVQQTVQCVHGSVWPLVDRNCTELKNIPGSLIMFGLKFIDFSLSRTFKTLFFVINEFSSAALIFRCKTYKTTWHVFEKFEHKNTSRDDFLCSNFPKTCPVVFKTLLVQCVQFKSENICMCKRRRTRGVLYCLTLTCSITHTHTRVCAAGPVWLASDAHKHSTQCHKQCEVSVVEGLFRSFTKVKIQIHSGGKSTVTFWNITQLHVKLLVLQKCRWKV